MSTPASQVFQAALQIAEGALLPPVIKFLQAVQASPDPLKVGPAVVVLQADILEALPNLVDSEISALNSLLIQKLQALQPAKS